MQKINPSLKNHKKYLILTLLAGAFMFGALFYLIFRLLSLSYPLPKCYEVTNHFINILHALFVSISTLLILRKKIKETTWEYLLAITQGYFIYDLVLMTCFADASHNSADRALFLVHHVFIFIISLYARFRPYLKQGLLSEIGLPFLLVGLVIKQIAPQYTHSIFFYVLGVLAILFYFVFRICNFIHILWHAAIFFYNKQKNNLKSVETLSTFAPFILFIVIAGINYYWFFKILKGVFRLIQRS